MRLYACCGLLLCPAYPQHFAHGYVDKIPGYPGRAGTLTGAVAASDAFFPFADGAEILINAGVKAIVQPGGSIRDEEVFEAARKAGVTMYVTGTRHFFH